MTESLYPYGRGCRKCFKIYTVGFYLGEAALFSSDGPAHAVDTFA